LGADIELGRFCLLHFFMPFAFGGLVQGDRDGRGSIERTE